MYSANMRYTHVAILIHVHYSYGVHRKIHVHVVLLVVVVVVVVDSINRVCGARQISQVRHFVKISPPHDVKDFVCSMFFALSLLLSLEREHRACRQNFFKSIHFSRSEDIDPVYVRFANSNFQIPNRNRNIFIFSILN